LAIIIDANGAGAVREFNKVGKSADKELGKSTERTRQLGASLTQVGAVMVGVGAVLVGGAIKAAQAFERQQMAELRLQNTIERMPMLAGASSKAFLEQASALQRVTKYGDETTIASQAMLGTFNMTEKQILELMPLVQDYASKFGTDLTDASKQVGKAVMGQIGALQRNGVTIDQNLYKTDRFTAVMQALRDQAGGFAEEEGKTMSGQLAILRNNLGDVAETVGAGAVGAFNKLLGPLLSVSDAFKSLPPVVGQAIGGFAAFGGIGLIFAGTASIMIGQLLLMKERFAIALGAAQRFAAFIRAQMAANLLRTAAVLGVVGLAAAGLAVAFKLASDAAEKRVANSLRGLGSDAKRTEAALLELGRTGRFIGVLADDADSVRFAMQDLKDVQIDRDQWVGPLNALAGWLQSVTGEGKASKEALEQLDSQLTLLHSTSVTEANRAFEELSQKLQDSGWSMEEIKAAFPSFIDAQTAGREATGEFAEETRELVEALDAQRDALNSLFDPVFAAIKAGDGLRDSQNKAREAALKVTVAQKAYDDAVQAFGENSPAAVEAAFNLMGAHNELRDAELNNVEAAQKHEAALLSLAKQQAETGGSTKEFEDKLDDWVAKGAITEDMARRMKEEFYRVRDAAGEIPPSTAANIDSNASSVLAIIQTMKRELATLSYGDLRNGAERLVFGPFVDGDRFTGGPVTARTPYLVGERGPEIFTPTGSGSVIPDHRTRTALATMERPTATAPGDTYNITVNGLVGRDKREILDYLASELPKVAARTGRSYS
jgi:polyhydroxyalkanoate synthesis regulator phasin